LSFFPAQLSPQQSQHFKKEKQLQQHEYPQQQHRAMQVTIERTIRETITMTAMTGHLKTLARTWRRVKGDELAIGFCHTVVPARKGIFDAVHLARNCSLSNKAVQHYVANSPSQTPMHCSRNVRHLGGFPLEKLIKKRVMIRRRGECFDVNVPVD
jgi:hypothetical protein